MAKEIRDFIKLFIAAIVIIALLPAFLSAGSVWGSAQFHAAAGEEVVVDSTVDDVPRYVTVEATTENALAFDGESYVDSAAPADLDNGSWSVCVATELDEDAHQKGTYTAFAYENETILLQYDAGDWSAYYDSGATDAKATIEADIESSDDGLFGWFSDDGDNRFVPVCGVYNESDNTLVVSADGTTSDPVTLDSSTTARNLSSGWVGKIDETRTFSEPLTDSQLQQYADDPIKPLPAANRTSRVMFDEGQGSTTEVYFADGSATIHGASWTDGVNGPSLENGTDYEVTGSPFSFTVLSGGYLDGSPVQYLEWEPLPIPINLVGFMGMLVSLLLLVTFANKIQNLMG